MSALNVIQARDAIYLLTDGAQYRWPELTVSGFGAKVYALPHARCCLAYIGGAGMLDIVGPYISTRCGTIDDAAQVLTRAISLAFDARRRSGAPAEPPGSSMVHTFRLVGFDQDCIRKSYSVTFQINEPIELVTEPQLQSEFIPGVSMSYARRALGVGLTEELKAAMPRLSQMGNAEIERFALLVAETQHRMPYTNKDVTVGEPFFLFGVFAQLVSITFDTISMKILKRWPQDIGKKIVPLPYEDQPSHDACAAVH